MGELERETLHKYIDQADNKMIRLIHAIAQADMKDKREEFERKLLEPALKSVSEGRTLSHEEVMANTRKKFPQLFK